LNHLRIHEPDYSQSLPSALTSTVVLAGSNIFLFSATPVSLLPDPGQAIDYEPDKVLSTASPSSTLADAIRNSSKLLWRGDELHVGKSCFYGCSCWSFGAASGSGSAKTFSNVSLVDKKRRREQRGFLPRAE